MSAKRDIRIAFAKSFIISNPGKGKDAINVAIKKEFGTGLRRIDVSKLKDATLLARPSKPTGRKSIESMIKIGVIERADIKGKPWEDVVGFEDAYHRLISAGFIKDEIKTLLTASGGRAAFKAEPFIEMMKKRRSNIRGAIKKGLSRQQVVGSIEHWHQRISHSEWDFLREVYDRDLRVRKVRKQSVKDRISSEANLRRVKKARSHVSMLYNKFGKPKTRYSNYGKGSRNRLI